MDMKILKEREFPLLKRKRVACMFEFTGPTPSIVQFRDSLSSKFKGSPASHSNVALQTSSPLQNSSSSQSEFV